MDDRNYIFFHSQKDKKILKNTIEILCGYGLEVNIIDDISTSTEKAKLIKNSQNSKNILIFLSCHFVNELKNKNSYESIQKELTDYYIKKGNKNKIGIIFIDDNYDMLIKKWTWSLNEKIFSCNISKYYDKKNKKFYKNNEYDVAHKILCNLGYNNQEFLIPVKNTPYIFLSYDRNNSSIMLRVAQKLIENNIPVWWDEGIPSNTEYKVYLNHKIKNAKYTFFLISDSVISKGITSGVYDEFIQLKNLKKNKFTDFYTLIIIDNIFHKVNSKRQIEKDKNYKLFLDYIFDRNNKSEYNNDFNSVTRIYTIIKERWNRLKNDTNIK